MAIIQVDARLYFEMCTRLYCGAADDDERQQVVCETTQGFARECTDVAIIVQWRSASFCREYIYL